MMEKHDTCTKRVDMLISYDFFAVKEDLLCRQMRLTYIVHTQTHEWLDGSKHGLKDPTFKGEANYC